MTPSENLERLKAVLERKSAGKIPSNGLRRTTRLSPRSADKAKREKKHAEEFGDQSRMCRQAPCCVPGCRAMPPQDPHHIESRNAAGKDCSTVPLCKTRVGLGREGHHAELHRIGQKSFQAKHQLLLEVVARAFSEAVRDHACSDWALQDPKTGEVSCAVCLKPCDAPVGP